MVDDATEAADFIDSDKGVQWLPAPSEIRHEVAEMIRALSQRTFRGSLTKIRLNVSGSCLELELSSEYLENCYVGLEWDMTSANFTVRWAKPLWELSSWHAEAETSTIATQIRNAAKILRDPWRGVRELATYNNAVALHTHVVFRAFVNCSPNS